MNTEAVSADQQPLWNRGNALTFKYGAIAFTIFNAIISLLLAARWVILWTKLNGRSNLERFIALFVAIVLPLCTPYTALAAWQLTKKLTSGAEYRKEIMWTLWYGLTNLLFFCYIMMNLMMSFGDLTR
jgi:magnesium-transporting ATPase (P-type)